MGKTLSDPLMDRGRMDNSLEKYRKIFDEALDMILVCNMDSGIIIDCNQTAVDVLGYSKDELIGRHQKSIHPSPEIRGRFSRTYEEHISSGKDDILESQVVKKDGTVFDVAIKASIFELDGRKVIMGIFRDITDKKRYERKLESIAAFPEQNPHPVLRVARDGTVVYSNQAGGQLLEHWHTTEGQVLPSFLCRQFAEIDDEAGEKFLEVPLDDKIYQFAIIPVKGEEYFNIYSMDITDRVEAEKALKRSEERYALAQKSARIGSWDWDLSSDRLHWSENIEPMLGLEKGAFHGTYKDFLNLVHPNDRYFLETAVANSLKTGDDYNLEHRVIHPDGSIHWLLETGKAILDNSGKPIRMLGIVQDITKRREIMEQIALLSRAVEQSSVSVVITDLEGRIVYVNPHFSEVSGFSSEEVIGEKTSILKSGRQDASFYRELWETIKAGKNWQGEFCNVDKYGREFWERATISQVTDHWGSPLYYVAVKENITERKKQEEKIEYLALHDSLTGLYNRVSFLDHFNKGLDRAKRKDTRLALLYFDLDGFKPVNDSLGHAAGDQVLRNVGERLNNSIRKMDVVARVGGDEFAILLPEFDNKDEVKEIARRILFNISSPIHLEKACCYKLAASIGITVYPDDGATADILLNKADQAMYAVKKSRRNSYKFYSDI